MSQPPFLIELHLKKEIDLDALHHDRAQSELDRQWEAFQQQQTDAPSAIKAAIRTTAQSVTEGGKAVAEGLLRMVTGQTQHGNKPSAMDPPALKMIFDGFMAMGLAPVAGIASGVGQAMENEGAENLNAPILDPQFSGFLRTALGQVPPRVSDQQFAAMPPEEQQRYRQSLKAQQEPMTGRELLEIATMIGVPMKGPQLLGMAKGIGQSAREAHGKAVGEAKKAVGGPLAKVADDAPGGTKPTRLTFTGESPEIQPLVQEAGGHRAAVERGFLRRAPDGHYEITDSGIRLLESKGPEMAASVRQIQGLGEAIQGGAVEMGDALPPPQVNLGRIAADDATKAVIAKVNQLAQAQGKTLGKQGHAATVQKSKGITYEEAMSLDLTGLRAQVTALRDLRDAASAYAKQVQMRARAGDPEARAEFPHALAIAIKVEAQRYNASHEVAGTLESMKILSEAERAAERRATRLDRDRMAEAAHGLEGEIEALRATTGMTPREASLTKAREKVAKLEQELAAAQEKAKAAEAARKELTDAKKDAERLKKEASKEGAENEAAARAHDRAVVRVAKLEQQVAEAQEANKVAARAKAELEAEKQKVKALTDELAAIQKATPRLAELQAAAQHAREQIDALGESLKDANVGARIAAEDLRALAEYIHADPTMAVDELLGFMERLPSAKRSRFAARVANGFRMGTNALYEFWMWELLSGPVTHGANVGSMLLTAAWAPAERFLMATWSAGEAAATLGRNPRSVFFGEVPAMLSALTGGVRDALKLVGEQLKEEAKLLRGRPAEQVVGFGPTKIDRPVAIGAEALGLDPASPMGALADYVGSVGRLTFRGLATEDAAFKTVLKRMEARALAYRDAARRGLEGAEFAEHVRKMIDEPTLAIDRQSSTFALTHTFNRELSDLGMIGKVGQAVSTAANAVPMARVVVPFINMPTNGAHWALERTPGINLALDTWRADLAAGGPRRAAAMSKMMTGGLVLATVGELAATPINSADPEPYMTMITGAGPKDPKRRRDLEANGWLPFAAYSPVTGKYYSMKRLQGGIVDVVMGVAQTTEIIGRLGGTDALMESGRLDDVLAGLTIAMGQYLKDKAMMKGLSDLFEALNDREGRAVERWVDNQWTSLGVPAIVRQTNKTIDPVMRDVRGALDRIHSGWFPDDHEAVIHPITGEDREFPAGWGPDIASPVAFSRVKNDPALSEINRNDVAIREIPRAIGPRNRTTTGAADLVLDVNQAPKGIPLTADERRRVGVIQTREIRDGNGHTLHEALRALVQTDDYRALGKGREGDRAVEIRRIYNMFQREAIDQFLDERPDFARALDEMQERQTEQRAQPQEPGDFAGGMRDFIRSLGR